MAVIDCRCRSLDDVDRNPIDRVVPASLNSDLVLRGLGLVAHLHGWFASHGNLASVAQGHGVHKVRFPLQGNDMMATIVLKILILHLSNG